MAYENGIRRNHHSDLVKHKAIQKKRHMKVWWVYFTTDFNTFCEYERQRLGWTSEKYFQGFWRIEGAGDRRQFYKSCTNSRIRSQERALDNLKGLSLEEVEEFEDDLVDVVCSNRVLNKQTNKWNFFDW